MTKRVRVTPHRRRGYEGVLLQVPRDVGFIRALKSAVPFTDRIFLERHPSGWWISSNFCNTAIDLATEHFGGSDVVDNAGVRTVQAGSRRCRQEVLGL